MHACMEEELDGIDVCIVAIDELQFLDSRMDLAYAEASANIAEEDLWGFV